MKNKQIHVVYITTNLINGKQYIGDHSVNDNIHDKYYGSGILIKAALKKYGKKNFRKEILEQFNSKEEAFNAQEKYILKHNTLIPNGYNINSKGGKCVHTEMSTIGKENISKTHKGKKYGPITEERRQNISNSLKGRKISKEHKKSLDAGRQKTQHNHTEETKRLISESMKRKHALKTKITKGESLIYKRFKDKYGPEIGLAKYNEFKRKSINKKYQAK